MAFPENKFSSKSKTILTTDTDYEPPGTMRPQRIDSEMYIRKLRDYSIKRLPTKNPLIILGELNMILGNKDRSTGNKGFCKSQKSPISEFHLEDPWRIQNPYACLYTYPHGRNLYLFIYLFSLYLKLTFQI